MSLFDWFKKRPEKSPQERVVYLTANAARIWPDSYVLVNPGDAKVMVEGSVVATCSGPYALDGLERMVEKLLEEHRRVPPTLPPRK